MTVLASTMMDLVATVDRAPDAGQTVVGRGFTLGFGGKGANQAVMAHRLGADVNVVASVGGDVFGDLTIDNFHSAGIATTYVSRSAGSSTGMAPILVEPDGTNRIVCIPGANDFLSIDHARAAVRGMTGTGVVVAQFETPQDVTVAAFEEARTRGSATILNPAPASRIRTDLLLVTDWLIPNETEALLLAAEHLGDRQVTRAPDDAGQAQVSDALIASLAEHLGVSIIVTLGSAGAASYRRGSSVVRVAAPTVSPVDTTGAGDAFVGAYAYGLASRLAPIDAVRLGCGAAALSVTKAGTQASFPTREEVLQIMSIDHPAHDSAQGFTS